jgi:hypothetical protein
LKSNKIPNFVKFEEKKFAEDWICSSIEVFNVKVRRRVYFLP